jgi:raffinose/stachyose/melibiose transport system substrate-binding protein
MTSLCKKPIVAVLAAVAALGLAACSPGSNTNNTSSSPAGGSASTGFDPSQKVTITVSDGWGTTGTGAAFGQVIKNFEAKYPNVTVNRETTDYATYGQRVLLLGNSPNPPDVMMLETSG